MRSEGRFIALTLDNFSGHAISYQPKNILIIFFEPNMTPYVQPLDAGIIRCFKAHYRQAFCLRAIEQDEAGKENVYQMDLLEAMLLAKKSWDAVSPQTIAHCWNHTKIQPNPYVFLWPLNFETD
jgi:DDE superfamily endonuclease